MLPTTLTISSHFHLIVRAALFLPLCGCTRDSFAFSKKFHCSVSYERAPHVRSGPGPHVTHDIIDCIRYSRWFFFHEN